MWWWIFLVSIISTSAHPIYSIYVCVCLCVYAPTHYRNNYLYVTGYKKRAHFAHGDDFPFVILRCSGFNVLPVAVCFASLASIVSELRSIELSHTEFQYFKIQAVKHSLLVKVSTFCIPTVLRMTYFKMAGDRSRQ